MDDLIHLAELIKQRNQTEIEITSLIQRPAQIGHIGEYIASKIFDIQLFESATHKSSDGIINSGVLAGQTVDIKWYAKLECFLDINQKGLPDIYLVLTGPAGAAVSSRGKSRPWLIEGVYLFDALELLEALKFRGVKIGVATSVSKQYWDEAEIYPNPTNKRYIMTENQRNSLALFR
jgi:hypothetical protein